MTNPVATKTEKGITLHAGWDELPAGTKIYTAPQSQRNWVGLTDDELRSMCKHSWVFETIKQWAQIIEAKLREKNGGTK